MSSGVRNGYDLYLMIALISCKFFALVPLSFMRGVAREPLCGDGVGVSNKSSFLNY